MNFNVKLAKNVLINGYYVTVTMIADLKILVTRKIVVSGVNYLFNYSIASVLFIKLVAKMNSHVRMVSVYRWNKDATVFSTV